MSPCRRSVNPILLRLGNLIRLGNPRLLSHMYMRSLLRLRASWFGFKRERVVLGSRRPRCFARGGDGLSLGYLVSTHQRSRCERTVSALRRERRAGKRLWAAAGSAARRRAQLSAVSSAVEKKPRFIAFLLTIISASKGWYAAVVIHILAWPIAERGALDRPRGPLGLRRPGR